MLCEMVPEILYQQAFCGNFRTSFQARNLICLVAIPHLWTLRNTESVAWEHKTE